MTCFVIWTVQSTLLNTCCSLASSRTAVQSSPVQFNSVYVMYKRDYVLSLDDYICDILCLIILFLFSL